MPYRNRALFQRYGKLNAALPPHTATNHSTLATERARARAHVRRCACVCARVHVCVYTYIYIYIHIYMCTYICIYIHIRIYIYIHVYIYAYMCTHMRMCAAGLVHCVSASAHIWKFHGRGPYTYTRYILYLFWMKATNRKPINWEIPCTHTSAAGRMLVCQRIGPHSEISLCLPAYYIGSLGFL